MRVNMFKYCSGIVFSAILIEPFRVFARDIGTNKPWFIIPMIFLIFFIIRMNNEWDFTVSRISGLEKFIIEDICERQDCYWVISKDIGKNYIKTVITMNQVVYTDNKYEAEHFNNPSQITDYLNLGFTIEKIIEKE